MTGKYLSAQVGQSQTKENISDQKKKHVLCEYGYFKMISSIFFNVFYKPVDRFKVWSEH